VRRRHRVAVSVLACQHVSVSGMAARPSPPPRLRGGHPLPRARVRVRAALGPELRWRRRRCGPGWKDRRARVRCSGNRQPRSIYSFGADAMSHCNRNLRADTGCSRTDRVSRSPRLAHLSCRSAELTRPPGHSPVVNRRRLLSRGDARRSKSTLSLADGERLRRASVKAQGRGAGLNTCNRFAQAVGDHFRRVLWQQGWCAASAIRREGGSSS